MVPDRRLAPPVRLVIPWIDAKTGFPPVEAALREPNGLLAAGGDLRPERLLDAYRRGIYPWFSEGQPALWWSPDPRMVLYVDAFRASRSLRRRIARREFDVRIDTAFRDVIEACARAPRKGQEGTWITQDMIRAYVHMHELGYAHSVEAWRDGELVGGLYGLALARVFFGESMFADATDASKVCLAELVATMRRLRMTLIDCQQETGHLASLGARPIPRAEFVGRLRDAIDSAAPPSPWQRAAQPA